MRKKHPLIFTLAACLLCLLIGGAASWFIFKEESHIPRFFVTGDVYENLIIKGFEGFETISLNNEGEKLTGMILSDIVEKASPINDDIDVLAVGDDGLSSLLTGGLDGAAIYYSIEHGWELKNELHPKSSNIRHLHKLIIVTREGSAADLTGVFDAQTGETHFLATPGQAALKESAYQRVFEGESQKTYGNDEYGVAVYTERYIIPIPKTPGKLRIYTAGGRQVTDTEAGHLELSGNSFDYRYADGKRLIEDVRAVMLNTTEASITDAYGDALNALMRGKKATVFLLDGFPFFSFSKFVENGDINIPEGWGELKPAVSGYRPVSQPGLAAILTGEDGSINGITERRHREVLVPDVFASAATLGKSSIYIEGDQIMLKTSIKPVVNLDLNDNGTNDDEIFESAIKAVDSDPDLLFVHFHGIDDTSHDFGPHSLETLEAVKRVLNYTAQTAGARGGTIIVTADHGQHTLGDGGYHGDPLAEDMIVPYFRFDAPGR